MSRAQLNRIELLEGAVCSAMTLQEPALHEFGRGVVDAFLEVLARNVLEQGKRYVLPGFGTFYRATWSPKVGKLRGEKRYRLAFKASNSTRSIRG